MLRKLRKIISIAFTIGGGALVGWRAVSIIWPQDRFLAAIIGYLVLCAVGEILQERKRP